jgi:transcriptional regulator GlxA family with amidase domain
VLGAAGLLDGLTATTHWGGYSELAAFGATPTPERVVEHLDRRIITAAGVSAGIDMALRLTQLLADETAAQAAQLMIEYDPQPPFDCGHMSKASATTKAAATALLSKDSVKAANVRATTMLAWEQALAKVRSRRRRRQPVGSSA